MLQRPIQPPYRLAKATDPDRTMATSYSLIRAQQADAAIQFGKMLRRWRVANNWTQYTAKRWAEEAGHPSISHSGLSELEQAKTRAPRAGVFLSLAELNERVANADFSGVRSRDLLDQLKGSIPIAHEDGRPWGPADFWECHCGLRAAPAYLSTPAEHPCPKLTNEQAAELCGSWAAQARQLVATRGGKPADLMRVGASAPARFRDAWASVALGLATWSPHELAEVWDPQENEWRPAAWLAKWADSLPRPLSGGGGGGG